MKQIRLWASLVILCALLVEQAPHAVADDLRQAVPVCADVDTLPVEVPEDFPGVLFSSALSEDVPGSIDLVLLTNRGLQSIPLPDPLAAHMQANELAIQSVSPDGRLISFRPVIYRELFPEPTPLPDTPFYIWDLQTNEVAIIPLVEKDIELFIGRTSDQQGFARWADSSNMILHYITQHVEEGTGIITRSVEISTDPLIIILDVLTPEVDRGSQFSFGLPPNGIERNRTVTLSPQGDVAAVRTGMRGLSTTTFQLDIFAVSDPANALYSLVAEPSLYVRSPDIWSPDGRYFLTGITDVEQTFRRPLLLDRYQEFAQVNALDNAIASWLSEGLLLASEFGPKWSADSSSLMLDFTSPAGPGSYILLYNVNQQSIQQFCMSNSTTQDYVTSFWSPDDQYFGFNFSGNTLVMNKDTGDVYRLPTWSYIGWVETSPIVTISTANAGPDQAIIDADNNGSASVTLDGSASSDSDGTITSYAWTLDGAEIATGAAPTVELPVGTHTITLTVIDDDGAISMDMVTITVNAPTSRQNEQIVNEQRDLPTFASTSYSLWSSDSQAFTFIDLGNDDLGYIRDEGISYGTGIGIASTLQEPYWVAYYPATEQYIAGYDWQAQPEFTPTEQAIVNTQDLVRSSPDGSVLLYTYPPTASVTRQNIPTLRIFNRATLSEFDTEIGVSLATTSILDVLWSAWDDRIAISVQGEYGVRFYYISNYLLPEPEITELGVFEIDGIDYFIDDALLDISDDGTKLLLIASRLSQSDPDEGILIVYDPIAPTQSRTLNVIDRASISDAAFSPNNANDVIVIHNNGDVVLIEGNDNRLSTLSSIELGVSTIGFPSSPHFSPDGHWLAYFSTSQDGSMLNMLDVSNLLQSSDISSANADR